MTVDPGQALAVFAVAVKLDYTVLNNQSDVIQAPNSLNIGLGWWF